MIIYYYLHYQDYPGLVGIGREAQSDARCSLPPPHWFVAVELSDPRQGETGFEHTGGLVAFQPDF